MRDEGGGRSPEALRRHACIASDFSWPFPDSALRPHPSSLLFGFRDHREVIGPERGGEQALFVGEVDDWVIGPAVAYGDRMRDGRAVDDHLVAFNLRLRVHK